MTFHAKNTILFLVTACFLAVIGLAEVNVRGLANVKSYGDIVNFAAVDGEVPFVKRDIEARAVTITDYDCSETSATPESTSVPVKPSSPPEVTPAVPGESSTINVPPAAPTVNQPVPTTMIISVGKPPVTPETPTSPAEHATSSVPGTGVEVTCCTVESWPFRRDSFWWRSASESPSSGGSGVEVSVTVSACEGCPTASTSTDVVTETSSGQATSEVSSSEGVATVGTHSSGEHTPSATPMPNEASPLKGMHLAGLGLAAFHLIM
ncbi:hypothetical protein PHISCL_07878 [Aspergillus sclerotialis]|uniref:GPI anchored protein n=1 Tax=Aspergillus sclerotialis TaxID=2070753 RepID=A0A3A2ZAZ1_9EURO|nr:hypothetical protein PHISCL_07878 [Aspergillus sclerotialis]